MLTREGHREIVTAVSDFFFSSPLYVSQSMYCVYKSAICCMCLFLETYTSRCPPSFLLLSFFFSCLPFNYLAFIWLLRWAKIYKKRFVNSMSHKHLPVLIVVLPFPYIRDITYFLNMLLIISSLQYILTAGSGTFGEQSHIPHRVGLKCGLMLHTFVLALCICA